VVGDIFEDGPAEDGERDREITSNSQLPTPNSQGPRSDAKESSTLPSNLPHARLDDLWRKAEADRWGLSRELFTEALTAGVRHAFREGEPSARDLDRHLAGLHVADLALATACALGRDAAWDHFVLTHRPVLYRAADALDPSGGARETADSLYADLYGLRGEQGERRSLFRYFHGRSSLATWLRAVLAQRHVDALRAKKRLEPLPDDGLTAPAAAVPSTDPDRSRLVPLVDRALRDGIAGLPVRDRLRLRSYYVTGLTLAAIGRLTGEHEATVSRHLARTRRDLRDRVERTLREHNGLGAAEVGRALELSIEDPGTLDLEQLIGPDSKEPPRDRSREEG
jgi:RNA polymerase sigma-70 factor (ECF subfamily)